MNEQMSSVFEPDADPTQAELDRNAAAAAKIAQDDAAWYAAHPDCTPGERWMWERDAQEAAMYLYARRR